MDTSQMDADTSQTLDDSRAETMVTEDFDQEVDTFELGRSFLTLPPQILKSLDLVESKGSLLKLLNRCSTPQGSRLCQQWIIHPLTDAQEIEGRLDLVEFFVDKPAFRTDISDQLKKLPDFGPLVKKLERRRVGLQDLYKIYVAVLRIPILINSLKKDLDERHPAASRLIQEKLISKLEIFYDNLENYRELVKQTVDIEYVTKCGEYRIRPSISESLKECNAALENLLVQMRLNWDELAEEVGLEKEKVLKFEHDSRLGHLYRVTRKEEKALRPHFGKLDLITVDTKTSGFRFRTPVLADLNIEYRKVTKDYNEAQQEVIEELVATAESYHEPCKAFNKIVAPLDVICAFAKVAYEARIPYVRPKVIPKECGIIEMSDSRHPCMENFLFKDFTPNSVRFEHKKETFHIITGPNMGGKSTYIRQVALNVILAQIGSFVPCSSATISLVDGVYTRIGSGDSLTKGVSTFMMEMLETQDILKQATKYSLVIIDELGRGTSTYDGYGLAYAVAEHIAAVVGSYCLFTTHFNELGMLQKEVRTVVLSHVTALVSEEGITFQYQVRPGVSQQSFGVNVAKVAGLPLHAIESEDCFAMHFHFMPSITNHVS